MNFEHVSGFYHLTPAVNFILSPCVLCFYGREKCEINKVYYYYSNVGESLCSGSIQKTFAVTRSMRLNMFVSF